MRKAHSALDFGFFTLFESRGDADYAQTFKDNFAQALATEEYGLDTIWLGESHFRPDRAVMSAPLTVASAIAARTERVKLGLAVQVLPLGNPLHIAEEAAIVDHISEGRLEFGVGRSSFIDAYQGFNIPYDESRARFDESMEIIIKAWTNEKFSYEGEFYQFKDVNLVPKPLQNPHPPVRVAVQSRDTFQLVGKMGWPIFIRLQMSVPVVQGLLEEYRVVRQSAGFNGPNDVVLLIPVYVAETEEKALEEPRESAIHQRRAVADLLATAGTQEQYDRLKKVSEADYEEIQKSVIFGTPETVTEKLKYYQEELGITGLALDLNPGGQLTTEQVKKSMRMLSEKVMPNFK